MRLLRGIAVILAGLLIIALAGHFYLVREVETQLERIATRLALVGRLTWNRILIHPQGKVIITDLRFEPRDHRDLLRIDEITFRSENLAMLVAAILEVQRGRLPEALGMRLRGGQLPVGRPFTDWLDNYPGPGLPMSSAGCDIQERRFIDLNRLDYWDLALEAQLDYQLVVAGEELDLRARIAAGRLTDWRVRMRLRLEDPFQSIRTVPSTLAAAELKLVEIELNDLGYHAKLHDYCMRQADLDFNGWWRVHRPAWHRAWTEIGLVPDEIVEAAYRSFLRQPGSITLEARPEQPLAVARFEDHSLVNVLSTLPFQFRVDDSADVPLRFARTAPVLPPTLPAPEAPTAESEPTIVSPEAPIVIDPTTQALPPPPVPPGWKIAELERAEEFIGSRVRLLLNDESLVGGRLIEADEQALYLEIRSRAGLIARPYSLHRIMELRVPEQAP